MLVGGGDEGVVLGFGDDVKNFGHGEWRVGAVNVSGKSGKRDHACGWRRWGELDGAGDRLLAGEETGEVFNRAGRLALHAFVGARADVRGEDDVGQPEQRVIGGRGLLVEHVGGVGEQVLGLERGDQCFEVNQLAAPGVDDDRALFYQREILGVDQALGGGGGAWCAAK